MVLAALRILLACTLGACAPALERDVFAEATAKRDAGAPSRALAAAQQDAPEVSDEVPRAGADKPAPGAVRFACDEHSVAQVAQLRRLSMTQLANTLRDLTRWAFDAGAFDEATRDDDLVAGMFDAVLREAGLERLPGDRRRATAQQPQGAYRRLDQDVDQVHVDAIFSVSSELARALTTPGRMTHVVGACATDGDVDNDEACLHDFISRFGARALRRPLDDGDVDFYRAVYGSDPVADPLAYADLITVLLNAPEFLYFVESGEDELPGQPGTHALSAHELAARLSYHFWQTLPDDALWQAAQDGSLLDPEVLGAQTARLLADRRAQTTMEEFYADLLALEDVPALDTHVADARFAAYAGADLPGPALRTAVIEDALGMLGHYTFSEPGGVAQLFTSERSFARELALARIYGVEPWDGRSAPPRLPKGERTGLLTRAWLLVESAPNTRPIRRGAFIRRQLLCDELAPPPANVNAMPPEPSAGASTREAVEALTEQPGTACAACHAGLINPLGFALEGFDALGRAREYQRIYDDVGVLVGEVAVDTRSSPRVTPDDGRASSGPSALADLLLQSGKLEACLVRHYFRFTFGRYEDLKRDGCALERLRSRLVESGRIRDMLEEVARMPELRQRTFEATP